MKKSIYCIIAITMMWIHLDADPDWQPAWMVPDEIRDVDSPELGDLLKNVLPSIKGLVWRRGDEIVVNPDRPFIQDLNDLPIPLHHLLPLDKYRMPLIKGPYAFVVPSRGCPAGCKYCIKHVSYNYAVRLRTAEDIMAELWSLKKLGVNNVMMYADLFTVNREQVMSICRAMIDEKIEMKWMCNSRVDYVDEEMLSLMGQAGCHMISWGIESGSEEILKRAANISERGASMTGKVWGGTFHATANRLLRIYAKHAGLEKDFTIMDQSDAEDMMNVIRSFKEEGASVLLITHQETIALMADHASQLCGGRIIASGNPKDVAELYKQGYCVRCDGERCMPSTPSEIGHHA